MSKPYKTRNITVCRYYGTRQYFPEIRLRGKWLKDMGFEIGQVITITCNSKKLIIDTDGSFKYPREEK